ncbi:hypothetical protein BHE74_00053577 [Ensete ventricosum]|nr:hypothetical protein GW17_00024382 [Ensete ventricosum]RWW40971.1 hypothetical protein BHE74_00053577 [Ensete ventricosum]RZS00841.1 hypothetical protein BHM03_00030615 [Ensete ventricosum]
MKNPINSKDIFPTRSSKEGWEVLGGEGETLEIATSKQNPLSFLTGMGVLSIADGEPRISKGYEVGAPVTALGGVLKKSIPLLGGGDINSTLENLGNKEHPSSKARPVATEERDS